MSSVKISQAIIDSIYRLELEEIYCYFTLYSDSINSVPKLVGGAVLNRFNDTIEISLNSPTCDGEYIIMIESVNIGMKNKNYKCVLSDFPSDGLKDRFNNKDIDIILDNVVFLGDFRCDDYKLKGNILPVINDNKVLFTTYTQNK